MRARVGGASTTSFLLAAHFAKRNTKFGGGGKIGIGKRWRAKIPSPQPPARLAMRSVAGRPSFLPARAFSFCRAKRGNQSEFRSKRFELRSAIATNQDISNFQGKKFKLVGVLGIEPSLHPPEGRVLPVYYTPILNH